MKTIFKPCVLSLSLLVLFTGTEAQDLQSLLEEHLDQTRQEVTATFKATRILNGHSVERMTSGAFDFRISHRFGRINGGAYELFGLDQAHIHLSLEYGILDWLMLGLGRGTFEKTVDQFIKISPIRQSAGSGQIPVSVSWISGQYINGLRWSDPNGDNRFLHRISYVHQVLIARKFTPGFSLQISPSYLHRNMVNESSDPNDIFAIGAGSRLKLSSRISLNAEYYYLFIPSSDLLSEPLFNPLSLGIDIETGGHVFQLIFTNSVAMREHGILGQTTGRWLAGDIHFGFNVSRVFQLKKATEP